MRRMRQVLAMVLVAALPSQCFNTMPRFTNGGLGPPRLEGGGWKCPTGEVLPRHTAFLSVSPFQTLKRSRLAAARSPRVEDKRGLCVMRGRKDSNGEEDHRNLRCTCGEVQIRLGGSKSTCYAVSCACGDCRSGLALGMVKEGKQFPARGHVPDYPLDGLYVPDDLSVLKGKDKLVAFKLKEGEDGVRTTRLYASCCWSLLVASHVAYGGWVACLRKHVQPIEDIPPAQYRLFTEYLDKYLDEDEIAKLPAKESIAMRDRPFLKEWIGLTKTLRDIDQRREGTSFQQLIEEAGPVQFMGVSPCKTD